MRSARSEMKASGTNRRGRARRSGIVVAGAVALAVIVPTAAIAHVERSTFWPDPSKDTSVKPAAGGKVPEYRPLADALKKSKPGDTRIVCQDDSLALAKQ